MIFNPIAATTGGMRYPTFFISILSVLAVLNFSTSAHAQPPDHAPASCFFIGKTIYNVFSIWMAETPLSSYKKINKVLSNLQCDPTVPECSNILDQYSATSTLASDATGIYQREIAVFALTAAGAFLDLANIQLTLGTDGSYILVTLLGRTVLNIAAFGLEVYTYNKVKQLSDNVSELVLQGRQQQVALPDSLESLIDEFNTVRGKQLTVQGLLGGELGIDFLVIGWVGALLAATP